MNVNSCETALHELISDLNKFKSNKGIALLLFIDFRKAFELVDSRILLRKLVYYGFDNDSIELITNYFNDRSQTVKIKNKNSNFKEIKLGCVQGGTISPLLFLIFINYLAFLLKEEKISCKMFADDTTLYDSDTEINPLISKFKKKLEPLFDWCTCNRLDINWSKTFFMFITNKHIAKKLPSEIKILNFNVKVVDSFKLLLTIN